MRLWIALTTLTMAVCMSLVLYMLLPPTKLVFAAGTPGGAYALMAQRYKDILSRDNIDVEIVYTQGSMDNAMLMSSGHVDATLLQAGILTLPETAEAIGGVFFEPMIFLVRKGSGIPPNPALWQGLRMSSGQDGSGTAAAFVDFQHAVGLAQDANTHVNLGYAEAISALKEGRIDLAFFVTSIEAPYLTKAFGSMDLEILELSYVEAISRQLEYADIVTVPSGAISLNPVQPSAPREVMALKARLVIDPYLHPALVNRLTMAAKELHGNRDILTNRGAFPAAEGMGLPVNSIARQLIQEGPSTWHNLLPYWMAAQLNRVLLLTLPILLLLVPMLRILPLIYSYFRGWQVWQYYGDIRLIEAELDKHRTAEQLADMDQELDMLDSKITRLKLPAPYRQAAYHARMHIDLVRKRIRHQQNQQA